MRHGVKTKKLGRSVSHRKSLMRNLATSLFEKGQIITTLGRAKAIRPFVEKLVTVAKTNSNLTAIRSLKSVLFTENSIKSAMEYGKLFDKRAGGYLRVVKNGYRYGDSAPMAVVQFVEKKEDIKA